MDSKSNCLSLFSSFCFLPQERLSYIGPEEFVQAFVQKDPLDNDKVTSAFLQLRFVFVWPR